MHLPDEELGAGAELDLSDNVTLGARYDTTAARQDLFYSAVTGKMIVHW